MGVLLRFDGSPAMARSAIVHGQAVSTYPLVFHPIGIYILQEFENSCLGSDESMWWFWSQEAVPGSMPRDDRSALAALAVRRPVARVHDAPQTRI